MYPFNLQTEPYLSLSKLQNILGYKDMRSVFQWCKQNRVCIFHQGNRKLVNTGEFILSFYRPFIKHLKSKHENWKQVFIGYLNGNLKDALESPHDEKEIRTKYTPKSESETIFLGKLKNL